MNQYHIYEKIGKGKHSTVYKGRKKKTIQYHAIKSVDKSQKPRVLQEVRTMHALDHKNILKFYAWYETTNHLWLILEYCVGGDLMSLLRQDVRLPESSIHDFGRDMVVALQFLHAHSIIYCDIKPSNILLDENGRLKLGGFGLSRRLSDINKTPVTNLPPAKRGTPCYMAPELFSEGATHSTASDLWSLGCVLYECATGSPPFMDSSFNTLVRDILNKEPAPIPGASPEFTHLLSRLLDKNPAMRIRWQELVEHPFWQAKLPVLPLPPEPALEAYIKMHNLAPAQGDDSAANQAVRSLRESVDLSRLSRIALSNLEKDEGVTDYTAAQPATAGGDITIDSADAELDFEEAAEQGGPDEDNAAAGQGDSDGGTDQHSRSSAATMPGRTPGQPAVGIGTQALAGSMDGRPVTTCHASQVPCDDLPSDNALPQIPGSIGDVAGDQQEARVKLLGVQQVHEHQQQHAILQQQQQQQQQRRQQHGGTSAAQQQETASGQGRCSSAVADSEADLLSLIWHSSDSAVKPIVANRRIERLAEPAWDAGLLPFAPITLQGMLECDQVELERFLTQVYRTIASSAAVKQKVNLLAYFESLCSDTAAANVLINSSLTVLFVRMLRNGKLPLLRIRLASVLGLLIRHATFIADELAGTHLVQILTEALGDKNERVRRRVMATLGELLFYVATQQQDSGAATVADASEAWGITQDTIAAVAHLLRPSEDEVCQHYAIKTIENICSQGGEWACKFAQQDVLLGLVGVYNSTKTENVKATTASTLSRLLRSNPQLLLVLLKSCGPQLVLKGLSDSNSKVQVSAVNVLNQALSQPESAALLGPLLQSEEGPVLAAVSGLLDHSLALLRAKALVTIMLLCRLSPSWLLRCCQQKLLLHVERLTRDKDTHMQEAIDCMHQELSDAVKTIFLELDTCLASLPSQRQQQKQKQQLGSSSGSSSGSHADTLEQLFVVLSLVTSPSFRTSVVNEDLIKSLSKHLLATSASEERQDMSEAGHMAKFRSNLMQVLEAVSQPEHMSLFPGAFLQHLMPALCSTIIVSSSSNSSTMLDTRFFCLRIMSDCLALYLTSTDIQQGPDRTYRAQGSEDASPAAALDVLLRRHVVPLVPVLLELEDPMPLYALKLLGGILDVNASYVAVVDELGLSQSFFDFLTLDHPNNNVHNIRLCRQLVLSGCISTQQLLQLRAADKVCAVLCYAQQNSVEPFLEPVLLLAHAMMLYDTPAVASSSTGQLVAVYLTQLLTFADLCSHADPAVALAAAQCVAQLAAACPGDAAQGLLSSGGTVLLTSALQASLKYQGPSAMQLQHQLLSAVNAVLSADRSPSRGDLSQLSEVLHVLLDSPDACVAAAANAAAERVTSSACIAC